MCWFWQGRPWLICSVGISKASECSSGRHHARQRPGLLPALVLFTSGPDTLGAHGGPRQCLALMEFAVWALQAPLPQMLSAATCHGGPVGRPRAEGPEGAMAGAAASPSGGASQLRWNDPKKPGCFRWCLLLHLETSKCSRVLPQEFKGGGRLCLASWRVRRSTAVVLGGCLQWHPLTSELCQWLLRARLGCYGQQGALSVLHPVLWSRGFSPGCRWSRKVPGSSDVLPRLTVGMSPL